MRFRETLLIQPIMHLTLGVWTLDNDLLPQAENLDHMQLVLIVIEREPHLLHRGAIAIRARSPFIAQHSPRTFLAAPHRRPTEMLSSERADRLDNVRIITVDIDHWKFCGSQADGDRHTGLVQVLPSLPGLEIHWFCGM